MNVENNGQHVNDDDDVNLTAYALGEISDSKTKARLEHLLKEDEDKRADYEATLQLAAMIRESVDDDLPLAPGSLHNVVLAELGEAPVGLSRSQADDQTSNALTSDVDSTAHKVSKPSRSDNSRSDNSRRTAYSYRVQALALTLCLTVVCTFAIWRPWESKTGEHDNVAMMFGEASDRQANGSQESSVEELEDSDSKLVRQQNDEPFLEFGRKNGRANGMVFDSAKVSDEAAGSINQIEAFEDKKSASENSLVDRKKQNGDSSHSLGLDKASDSKATWFKADNATDGKKGGSIPRIGIVQSAQGSAAQSSPARSSNVPNFAPPKSQTRGGSTTNKISDPRRASQKVNEGDSSSGNKSEASPAGGMSGAELSDSGRGGLGERGGLGGGGLGGGGLGGGGRGGAGENAGEQSDSQTNRGLAQQKSQQKSSNGRGRFAGTDLKKNQLGASPLGGMKDGAVEDNGIEKNRRARKQAENGAGSGAENMAPQSNSAAKRPLADALDLSDSVKPTGGRIANSTFPKADSYSGKNGNPLSGLSLKSGEKRFDEEGSIKKLAERNTGSSGDKKLSQLKTQEKKSEANRSVEREMKKKIESFSIQPEPSAKSGAGRGEYEKLDPAKPENLKSGRAIEPAMESKALPGFVESDPKGKDSSASPPAGKSAVDGEKHLKEAIEKESREQKQQLGRQPGKADMPNEELNRDEEIVPVHENDFVQPLGTNALSTFSIDTDTASYTNVRQKLRSNMRPNPADVRIEEMLNYFDYAYPQPKRNDPFSVTMEIASCPWTPGHKLLRVGMKAREISNSERPASNLVFLIDVSGSMRNERKLPLLQKGLSSLVDQLREDDYVSIVTYSDTVKNPLQPTDGSKKAEIKQVINSLTAGGSTNGSGGLEESYRLAEKHFLKGGTNRIVMGTDGDFNFGISDDDELVEFIKNKTEQSKVFLTVCGFGTDNFQDQKVQKMAQNGNGKVFYIDSFEEAKRVFVEKISGGLVTMAKDVKLQLLFNPRTVQSYRLIGYENRMLEAQDFDNDQKDAGEMDAGDRVTALYEIVPANSDLTFPTVADSNTIDLKYQMIEEKKYSLTKDAGSNEIATLRVRFKAPESDESEKREFPVENNSTSFNRASKDLQFASSVAGLGLLLRNSKHRGSLNFEGLEEYAAAALSDEKDETRKELLELIRQAKRLY